MKVAIVIKFARILHKSNYNILFVYPLNLSVTQNKLIFTYPSRYFASEILF